MLLSVSVAEVISPAHLRQLAQEPAETRRKVAIVGDTIYIATTPDEGHKELLLAMHAHGVEGLITVSHPIAPVLISGSVPPDQSDGFDLYAQGDGALYVLGSSAYMHVIGRRPTEEARERSLQLLFTTANQPDDDGIPPTSLIPVRRIS